MEYVGMKSVKDAYASGLNEKEDLKSKERAARIQGLDVDSPVFEGLDVYPEDEPDMEEISQAADDIAIDLMALDKEIAACAGKYMDLMNNMSNRLEAVNETLQVEQDRIEDLNMICGHYQEFSSVKTLNPKYFSGNFSYDGNYVFMAGNSSTTKSVKMNDTEGFEITEVKGNGYEGNEYVYDDIDGFRKQYVDTSIRSYALDDNNYVTAYEYSRLTADGDEDKYPADVKFDNKEAECTITLHNTEPFGMMKIVSDLDSMILKDVKYSPNDGATYQSILPNEIDIDSKDAIYLGTENYAYGSGVIAFPETNWLRLTLQSNGTTNDKIAFKELDTTVADKPVEKVIELPHVKRHVIRINDMKPIKGQFTDNSVMQTGNLVSTPVRSIAIFANEYVPPAYTVRNCFSYIPTINGIDYDVVPLNSDREGIKVIRFTNVDTNSVYTKAIDEAIKQASLKIVIHTNSENSSPVLSNVKICYGEAVK